MRALEDRGNGFFLLVRVWVCRMLSGCKVMYIFHEAFHLQKAQIISMRVCFLGGALASFPSSTAEKGKEDVGKTGPCMEGRERERMLKSVIVREGGSRWEAYW